MLNVSMVIVIWCACLIAILIVCLIICGGVVLTHMHYTSYLKWLSKVEGILKNPPLDCVLSYCKEIASSTSGTEQKGYLNMMGAFKVGSRTQQQ